jgi:hypothetical protein
MMIGTWKMDLDGSWLGWEDGAKVTIHVGFSASKQMHTMR